MVDKKATLNNLIMKLEGEIYLAELKEKYFTRENIKSLTGGNTGDLLAQMQKQIKNAKKELKFYEEQLSELK